MYYYRTASGPYRAGLGRNPDATLFERRDDILSKLTAIQKYALEPDPRTLKALGPLDANAYISERINGQITWFRARADQYSAAQGSWQAVEVSLAIVGALLGVFLTETHNQAFGAWVAVVTTIGGSVGAYILAERYDQLMISYRATADRLTGILGRWRSTRGPLGDLVEAVEPVLLEENQGWIAGADELLKDLAPQPPAGQLPSAG
jgi:hypothetical protein